MCIEHCIQVNMYHVSAQGLDKQMINVHYYITGRESGPLTGPWLGFWVLIMGWVETALPGPVVAVTIGF